MGAGIFAGWQNDKEEQKEAITAAAPETKTEEVTATPEPVSALESLQTRMEERVAKERGTCVSEEASEEMLDFLLHQDGKKKEER